ncbi:MAG: TetR/AcrR family transcriptional regulator [Acidobacteria bacterium]|nr:TetR/AcrR family transcriptional regulator [Acidobacteriota bacterium]
MKRQEILRSAAAAFRRTGYHGTTLEDISACLGMTKASLYYYFQSKEQILYECHRFSLEMLLDRLSQVQNSQMAPGEKIRALVKHHVNIMIDELQASAMILEIEALSPALRAEVIGRRDEYERGFRDILAEGVESEEFRGHQTKLASFAILGAINWIARWFSPAGPASAEEVGETFARVFLQGLRREEPPQG